MTTNKVSPDTGRTSNYEVLYSPHQACVRTQTRMLSENMGITRDPFNLRHDNLVVFTDLEGTPCDSGAKLLHELELLPKIDNLTLARARVMKFGKFNLIIIPIKEHITNSLKYETLVEAIGALFSITRELKLASVSIAKTNSFDNILWQCVQKKFYNTFNSENCKIIICLSVLETPRWLNLSSKALSVQIQGFSDASQLAMAAVVYLRVPYADKSSEVSLVCSNKEKTSSVLRVSL
ncbi:hypothetical protein M0802_016056 [Mischocyttarus mexicanus]|nr:hypothetical protein M0802_016056 [Mischocyttarus mexicanus]